MLRQDRVLDWEEVYASQTKKRTLADDTQKDSSSYMFVVELENFKISRRRKRQNETHAICVLTNIYIYIFLYKTIFIFVCMNVHVYKCRYSTIRLPF